MNFVLVNVTLDRKLIFHDKFLKASPAPRPMVSAPWWSFVSLRVGSASLSLTGGWSPSGSQVYGRRVSHQTLHFAMGPGLFIKAMKMKVHQICSQGKSDFITMLLISDFSLRF